MRCFDDDNIVHVAGAIDPTADTDVINFELILADIAQVERRLDRIAKQGFRRAKNDEEKHRLEAEQEGLGLIQAALEEQKPARAAALTAYQREAVAGLQLLTLKPLTYAANVAEDDLADADSNKYVQVRRLAAQQCCCVAALEQLRYPRARKSTSNGARLVLTLLGLRVTISFGSATQRCAINACDLHTRAESSLTVPAALQALRAVAEKEACRVIVISAQVEAELHQLEAAEAQEYLESLGVSEGGLRALVRATYGQLGLNTYFTTGEQETRAWTFSEGMTAPQCAGIIHSDFEKQFIRAETLSYDDFVACKGFVGAKDAGKARLEGKEYVVREGDVMLFRTGA